MLFLLPIFLFHLIPVTLSVRGDVTAQPDVIDENGVTTSSRPEVVRLREEVRKLRKTFNRFKNGGGRGRKKMCETASEQMSDKISMELSGLRSQLHTSDSMKSLRSELEYGLASLRSELDNKVMSVRAELDTGLTAIKSELQSAVSELKTDVNSELTDVRTELQDMFGNACSGEKELTTAISDLQAGLQTVKAELESRVATTRAELEQRVMGVRSELEGGLMGVQSEFKTDVVTVRSDLQDMVAGVRTELQDSMAGTRSELQTGFMAAQSGLQNSLQSLHADLMDASSKAQTDVATLRAKVSGMAAVVKAEVRTELTQTTTQMQDNMQTMEFDLSRQLEDVAKRVQLVAAEQSLLVYNASNLKQGLAELTIKAEKSVVTLKADLDSNVEKLGTRLDDLVSTVMSKLQRHTEETLSDASNNVTAIDKRLTFFQTDVDHRLTDLRIDLDNKVGDLLTEVKDSRTKMAADAAYRGSQLVSLAGNMSQTQEELEKQLKELQKDSWDSRGSTFVRWGRVSCTENSDLVYKGVVGGSSYDTDGGAANRLCLTLTPQAGNVTGARTNIYGAEYKFSEHHDMDVVCAVCHTSRPATIMVPGTKTCPADWSLQYTGHLTAGMAGHRAASEYLCLDSNPEHRAGSQEIRNGALFYYVFTECGSLPCPPYTNILF